MSGALFDDRCRVGDIGLFGFIVYTLPPRSSILERKSSCAVVKPSFTTNRKQRAMFLARVIGVYKQRKKKEKGPQGMTDCCMKRSNGKRSGSQWGMQVGVLRMILFVRDDPL